MDDMMFVWCLDMDIKSNFVKLETSILQSHYNWLQMMKGKGEGFDLNLQIMRLLQWPILLSWHHSSNSYIFSVDL